MKEQRVESFAAVDMSDLHFPSIAVFYNALDYPGLYVARLFDLEHPTDVMMVKETLEEIHEGIPPTFARLPRSEDDHESVWEVWI